MHPIGSVTPSGIDGALTPAARASQAQFRLQLARPRADVSPMTLQSAHRKIFVILLVALTWTAAGTAMASSPEAGARGKYRAECRRLTKQINHYEGTILPMAIQRGNESWERATSDQVERLWHRRADLCPEYGAQRTMLAKAAEEAKKFQELLVMAGKAAATYFTGGLSGGLMP